MADFFDTLSDKHIAMIAKQPVFFVATAAEDARINLSPKGYDAFRVLAPNKVAYLDLGGSGNETHAHLAADGRITLMFCNFEQPALILRIYGRGRPAAARHAPDLRDRRRERADLVWLGRPLHGLRGRTVDSEEGARAGRSGPVGSEDGRSHEQHRRPAHPCDRSLHRRLTRQTRLHLAA